MNEKTSQLYAQAAGICACASLRRASRAVTQLFDQHLETAGLRATQLIILLEVGSGRAPTVPLLSRRLVMDRSTVARSVARLIERGYIERMPSGRELSVSARGEETIAVAVPLWRSAQDQLVEGLGEERWRDLMGALDGAVRAARSTP